MKFLLGTLLFVLSSNAQSMNPALHPLFQPEKHGCYPSTFRKDCDLVRFENQFLKQRKSLFHRVRPAHGRKPSAGSSKRTAIRDTCRLLRITLRDIHMDLSKLALQQALF